MRRYRKLLFWGCIMPAWLSAQTTLYWDVNGATTDRGTGGGIWDTTTPNWTTGAGDIPTILWPNTVLDRAVFTISTDPGSAAYAAGGSYTVDVASGIQARGMDIGSVAWGPGSLITFNGAGITLTDPLVTVESVKTDFNLPLVSPVGLTLDHGFLFDGTLRLNTANPGLAGVATIIHGTLVYNHPGALGSEAAGNGIEIGDGTLKFDYVSGGDFTYTLADPIEIWGTNMSAPHISIGFETYATRAVTLSGPIQLDEHAWFQGGPLYDFGTAQIISTGVISEASAGKNILITGDVAFSGVNTFTGRVYVGDSYDDDGRLTIPVFNADGTPGPLGAGTGLVLGYNAGEGGAGGEVVYTGGSASSNRTIDIDGDYGLIGVSNAATTLTLTGVVSGSGFGASHDFEKAGPGTLVLRGNNTFTGDTYLTNGTLIVGHNNALGTGNYLEVSTFDTQWDDNLSLLLENGVTLNHDVEVYEDNAEGGSTMLGLAGSGSATFAGTVYIQRDIDVKADAGGAISFTDLFSDGAGGGSITKVGAGQAAFTGGVDLQVGGIIASQGGLLLRGSVYAAGGYHVSSSTTLSGDAVLTGGNMFVAGGGTLLPGVNGAGTLTMDNLYLASGGLLQWQLAALTTIGTPEILLAADDNNTELYPTAAVTVDLSLLGISSRPTNPDRMLNDSFWQVGQTWLLVDFTNGSSQSNLLPNTPNPVGVANGTWGGGTFTTFMNGTGDLMLQFTPVPEPSTYGLLALGAALVLLPRLRRRT